MANRQHELDAFSSKGKQLLYELNKIPDCEFQIIKKDMDTLVDQWMDVSSSSKFFMVVMCYFLMFS